MAVSCKPVKWILKSLILPFLWIIGATSTAIVPAALHSSYKGLRTEHDHVNLGAYGWSSYGTRSSFGLSFAVGREGPKFDQWQKIRSRLTFPFFQSLVRQVTRFISFQGLGSYGTLSGVIIVVILYFAGKAIVKRMTPSPTLTEGSLQAMISEPATTEPIQSLANPSGEFPTPSSGVRLTLIRLIRAECTKVTQELLKQETEGVAREQLEKVSYNAAIQAFTEAEVEASLKLVRTLRAQNLDIKDWVDKMTQMTPGTPE